MKSHELYIEEFLDFSLSVGNGEKFDDWLQQEEKNADEFLEMAHLDAMLYAAANEDADPANVDSIKMALNLEDRKRRVEQEKILDNIESYLQKTRTTEVGHQQVRIMPAWVWRTAAAACFLILLGVIFLVSFASAPEKSESANSGVTCNEIYEDDDILFRRKKGTNSAVLYRKIIINSYKKQSATDVKRKEVSHPGPGIILFKVWKAGYYYVES